MSSSPHLRRALLAASVALLAACHPMPSPQFAHAPAPDAVQASLLSRLNARQEAAVLVGLEPVIPQLVRQVWGVPAGVPWRLEVMMTPWRVNMDGKMSFRVDSTDETARDKARYAFRRAMEDSLAPPAPSRAWYVGDMRGVSVQQSRTSGDTLIVLVDVSAGTRCADGHDVMHSIAYDVAFIREAKGTLRLADRAPQWVTESGERTAGGAGAPANCAPTPLLGAKGQ